MAAFELQPAPRGNARTPSPPSPTTTRPTNQQGSTSPTAQRRHSNGSSPAAMPRRPSATYSHSSYNNNRRHAPPVVARTASHASSTLSNLSKDAPSTAVIDHEYANSQQHPNMSTIPTYTSITSNKPPVFNYARDVGMLSPASEQGGAALQPSATANTSATTASRPVRPKPRTANSGSKFGFVVNKDEEHPLKVLGEEDVEEQRVPLFKRMLHSKGWLLLFALALALIIALAVAIPVGLRNAVPDRGDMGSTLPLASPAPG